MYNKCSKCLNKIVPMSTNSIDMETKVTWKEWKIVKEKKEKIINGEKFLKTSKKSAKTEVIGTVKELKENFQRDMKHFKQHIFNIKTQNKAFSTCKENLNEEEAAIVVDFSENYACRLSKEIQSFHFGASRNQVTLHTGVLYVKENIISFASISQYQDHSPAAIWAHLNPILELLKEQFPQVKIIHFFSDGPSTQYLQKKNFYLLSTILLDLEFTGTWSYFESSHGKAAADGVGGTLKRRANEFVAYGGDIPDAETFYSVLKEDRDKVIFYITGTNRSHN